MKDYLPFDRELEKLDRTVVAHLDDWQAAALDRMDRPNLPLPQALEGLVLLAHRLSEAPETIRNFVDDFLFEDRFDSDPELAAVLAKHIDSTVRYVCRLTEERHHGVQCVDEEISPSDRVAVPVIDPGPFSVPAEEAHA